MTTPPLAPDALLEAVLFTASQPVALRALSEATAMGREAVERALAELEGRLAQRGIRLQRHGDRVQLVTAPEAAAVVERFLGLEARLRLSRAAMETLAIIAYAQPITRPRIEAIRGVNSDSPLRTLLAAGLIEEVGRADSVGRPILYGTTFAFLQQFGLSGLEALPPLKGERHADTADDPT